MHDDTSRGFPWFKLVFGGISILVLVGTFGGFMWLLRTYVDPPRVASGPSAAALLASATLPSNTEPSEPRGIVTAREDRPGLPPPVEPYERAGPPPNAGAPLPSWASSPLPNVPRTFGVASAPPAAGTPAPIRQPASSAEAGTVTFDSPVPLPRPKPRVTARAPATVAAPTALPSAAGPTTYPLPPPTAPAPALRPRPPA